MDAANRGFFLTETSQTNVPLSDDPVLVQKRIILGPWSGKVRAALKEVANVGPIRIVCELEWCGLLMI